MICHPIMKVEKYEVLEVQSSEWIQTVKENMSM